MNWATLSSVDSFAVVCRDSMAFGWTNEAEDIEDWDMARLSDQSTEDNCG